MALSAVMLLALASLSRSRVEGRRHWFKANVLAIVALLLFAGRGAIPDLLSLELANTTFMAAIAMMLVGFRRHFGLPAHPRALCICMLLTCAALFVFHYAVETTNMRIVAVSIFHGAASIAIGLTAYRSIDASRPRYPYLFTAGAGISLGIGHGIRALFYAAQACASVPLFDQAFWNVVFFSLGTLSFPTLTLGALMLAHAETLARAAYAADHDHLTGALSRRAFFTIAEREHARNVRTSRDLSLLVFDVDHFKRINDTYGHAAGDEVLADIVLRCQKVIRSIDVCARLGGEEFAVLLPEADSATASMVAERLRGALDSSSAVGHAGVLVSYTVSIGIATLTPGESLTSLMGRADSALYSAKAAGRNTVMHAPTEAHQLTSSAG